MATLVPFVLPACDSGGPRARAESASLRRQADALRNLIEAVEAGQAFSPKHVTLGISQELVRDLLQLTLPVEADAPPDLRVRLETAQVSFENGESRVTLRGRVSWASQPGTFADLVALGGLHRFEVAEAESAGRVTARVALDRVEVRQAEAAGVRRDVVEAVLDRLGATTLETLAAQIPPIAIPVSFERAVELQAVSLGPFEIAPGSLRLRVSLAEVVALRGRLWVLLDVKASAGPKPVGGGPPGAAAAAKAAP
jgi:hypothetical protein